MLDLIVVKFFDKLISRPIHLFGKFGFLLLVLGFIFSLYAVWLKVFDNISFILTPLPLLIVFFLFSGIFCILLGIIAEIQARIYFQATNNKSYLIRSIIKLKNKNLSMCGFAGYLPSLGKEIDASYIKNARKDSI